MNAETIFAALTALDDALVLEAERHTFQKKRLWPRVAAAAAALALVVTAAGVGTGRIRLPGLGSSGHNANGDLYQSYEGPVFPLTAVGDASGVTTERTTTFDFSPYEQTEKSYVNGKGEIVTYHAYRAEAIVTDAYLLTNGTDVDRTLTLLYPAALRLYDGEAYLPALTVDGAATAAEVLAGPYAGGFTAAWGSREAGTANLSEPASWETYRDLLADGSYQASALAALPDLSQPVVVYRIDDYILPADAPEAASLQFRAVVDDARVRTFSYGANSFHRDAEERLGYGNGALTGAYARPFYVFVLGGDLAGYALQGYANSGAHAGTECEIGATVTRSETTLGAALGMALDDHQARRAALDEDDASILSILPRERAVACLAEHLRAYGVLSDAPMERYFAGMLEDMMECFWVRRVIYRRLTVTIPARGSVTVAAQMLRHPSANYPGGGRDASTQGYDLVTTLGSTLTFTAQRAALVHAEEVALLENDFGFDREGGVAVVTLDPAREHYGLRVRKNAAEP